MSYKEVSERVAALVIARKALLVETLVGEIADLVLGYPLVQWVEVEIEKPDALADCDSVSVSLRRSRT